MKLKANDKLYDPIRKTFITKLPEEIVRQKLINHMIDKLHYPSGLLAVEKDLSTLPHLQNKEFKINKRRADIICFAKNIHPNYLIYPLLMIECKACSLTKKTIDQVLGYNHFVEAFFVAIANKYKIVTFWYNLKDQRYDSLDYLPDYTQLIRSVKNEK